LRNCGIPVHAPGFSPSSPLFQHKHRTHDPDGKSRGTVKFDVLPPYRPHCPSKRAPVQFRAFSRLSVMPPEPSPPLVLLPGLAFADLYSAEGAGRIDELFVAHLREADAGVASRLVSARANPESLSRKDESELLIAICPHLEDFLARLFG